MHLLALKHVLAFSVTSFPTTMKSVPNPSKVHPVLVYYARMPEEMRSPHGLIIGIHSPWILQSGLNQSLRSVSFTVMKYTD